MFIFTENFPINKQNQNKEKMSFLDNSKESTITYVSTSS